MAQIQLIGSSDINTAHRKEKGYLGSFIAYYIKEGEMRTAIDCRLYWAGQTAYCCMWIPRPNKWISSSAKAGGYGYNKKASATSHTISSLLVGGYKAFNDLGFSEGWDAYHQVKHLAQLLYPDEKIEILSAHP